MKLKMLAAAVAVISMAAPAFAKDASAKMIIHNAVADYAKWRPVYDADTENRTKAGLTDCQVHASADNANDLFVVCDMADLAKGKAFATSKALATTMAGAGVIGKPDIYFLTPTR